jgi:ribonuclease HI
MKGDRTPRGFEHAEKAIFCGKVKSGKKEQGQNEAEDEIEEDAPGNEVDESGRACWQKGWWKRGDVEAKLNTVNMTAWVHKECNIMDEEALIKFQEAWNNSERKDGCLVRLDDLERAFWMGTEVGQLGGYGFQGATLGVDGTCKNGKMGSGCGKFREEGQTNVHELAERRKARAQTGRNWGGVVLALQSAALSEEVLLLCDNEAVLCAIKKWVGQGGKATLATAPNADILRDVICLLTQRVRAGRATFLIKVKSHRREPINERADTLAEEGREILEDDKRWDDRTDRMTFEVRKGNTTARSVWTNSVRNTFRKQAGWAKLQETRAMAAKALDRTSVISM